MSTHVQHRDAELRGRVRDDDAGVVQRLDLALRVALATGDDGTGVACAGAR